MVDAEIENRGVKDQEAVAKQMLDDMNNNSATETNNEPTES